MTGISTLDDLLGAIRSLNDAPTLPALIERLEQALSGHRMAGVIGLLRARDGAPDLLSAGSIDGAAEPLALLEHQEPAVFRGGAAANGEAGQDEASWVHARRIMRFAAQLAAHHGSDDGSIAGLDDREARVARLLAVAFQARYEDLSLAGQGDMTLTARERDVLRWFADGKSAEDVAIILHISPGTVMFHYRRAAERLGTLNRTHTVVEAMRRGLIPLLAED